MIELSPFPDAVSPEVNNAKPMKDAQKSTSDDVQKSTSDDAHKSTSDLLKHEDREQWGSKAEFLLSCIGLSVGIGNVWRFPYLAYENGGGAFIIAYAIMLVIVGKPHFFAELAIGQFTGQGTLNVWRCFPIARGIGFAMITMSIMVAIYYNVVMCYTLYFIGQSFRAEVPWKRCFAWWGADSNCYDHDSDREHCNDVTKNLVKHNSTQNEELLNNTMNVTWEGLSAIVPVDVYIKAMNNCNNGTETAPQQFWERYVLQLSSGIDDLGTIKWDLALTLFVCWLIIFLGMMKGIKTSGKIVYFTATFPYVIIIILVIYGCTLSGAIEGLRYLFIPDWPKLLDIQVWRAAAEQLLFSLSLGFGCLIMYGSYNKFENKLYGDAMFVSSLDFLTSLLSGIVIFTVLGHLATEMGVDISVVAKGGQGLAFVTYPEAIAKLPIPQLWSVLFFFMLFLLALDSEFSYLENVFTVIYDEFPHLKKWKTHITFSFCMVFFLLGLPCVTQGGQYVLNLMDKYGGGYTVQIVATVEIVALMWGYGADRLCNDIEFMLGFRPNLYWRICWKFISPVVLLFVLIYSFTQHTTINYAGVTYPMWAEYLGYFLIFISVVHIPIWAMVEVYNKRKNLKDLFRPHPDWGPLNPVTRQIYKAHLPPEYKDSRDNHGRDNLGMEILPERP